MLFPNYDSTNLKAKSHSPLLGLVVRKGFNINLGLKVNLISHGKGV